jgi:hypothetical protein
MIRRTASTSNRNVYAINSVSTIRKFLRRFVCQSRQGRPSQANDNGVRVVNFAISKIPQPKVKCSHIVTFINLHGRLLMARKSN